MGMLKSTSWLHDRSTHGHPKIMLPHSHKLPPMSISSTLLRYGHPRKDNPQTIHQIIHKIHHNQLQAVRKASQSKNIQATLSAHTQPTDHRPHPSSPVIRKTNIQPTSHRQKCLTSKTTKTRPTPPSPKCNPATKSTSDSKSRRSRKSRVIQRRKRGDFWAALRRQIGKRGRGIWRWRWRGRGRGRGRSEIWVCGFSY